MKKRFQYKALSFSPTVSIGDIPNAGLLGVTSTPTVNWSKVKAYSLAAVIATTAFVPVVAQAETITVDKWFAPISQPVIVEANHFYTGNSFSFHPVPVIVTTVYSPQSVNLTKEYRLQYQGRAEPVLVSAPAITAIYSQQTNNIAISVKLQYQGRAEPLYPIVVSENVTLDKWYQRTSEPRAKVGSRVHLYPAYFSDVRQPIPNPDTWYRPTEQKAAGVKSRVHTYPSYFSSNAVIVPMVQIQVSQPIFIKSKRHLFPYLFLDANPLPNEVVTLDKWFNANIQPYFKRKQWGFLYPTFNADKNATETTGGIILGRNNDTNTGVGKRGRADIGRNTDTNTGIGKRGKADIGRNRDTNTSIGTRRIR